MIIKRFLTNTLLIIDLEINLLVSLVVYNLNFFIRFSLVCLVNRTKQMARNSGLIYIISIISHSFLTKKNQNVVFSSLLFLYSVSSNKLDLKSSFY